MSSTLQLKDALQRAELAQKKLSFVLDRIEKRKADQKHKRLSLNPTFSPRSIPNSSCSPSTETSPSSVAISSPPTPPSQSSSSLSSSSSSSSIEKCPYPRDALPYTNNDNNKNDCRRNLEPSTLSAPPLIEKSPCHMDVPIACKDTSLLPAPLPSPSIEKSSSDVTISSDKSICGTSLEPSTSPTPPSIEKRLSHINHDDTSGSSSSVHSSSLEPSPFSSQSSSSSSSLPSIDNCPFPRKDLSDNTSSSSSFNDSSDQDGVMESASALYQEPTTFSGSSRTQIPIDLQQLLHEEHLRQG